MEPWYNETGDIMGKIKLIMKNVNSKQNKESVLQQSEIKNLIIIVLIIVAIFFIFYGITAIIDPGNKPKNPEIVEETIQYNEIMVGQILNRSDKNYYVLVINNENEYNGLYESYLDMYVSKNKDGKYYTVDLDNAFNQKYRGESTLLKGNDVSLFKFSDTTLIKIKNQKIDKVYAEKDEIVTALKKEV